MKKIGIWAATAALSILLLAGVSPVQGAPTTLSMADQNSNMSWGPVHATQPWAKKVEEVTKGQVKVQIYPSQTLAKGPECWDAVRDGIADMAWFAGGQHPGRMPYMDVITLPGLFKTAEKGSEIIWKLYEKFPSIQKELADNQVIILHTINPFNILTSKKPVKTLEDLKGLKIRTVAGQPTEQLKLLGATTILLPMPDCFEALDKGVVDGMLAPMEPIPGYKLYEVTKYIAEAPIAANYFTVVMNKKRWSQLSKENQAAIMGISGLEGSKWFGKNFADTATEGVPQIAKQAGYQMTVYSLPEAERQRWIEVSGKPLWEAWVKGCESKGLNEARKILDTALEFAK
jgi:TRAP-type transport system periplasmic protein